MGNQKSQPEDLPPSPSRHASRKHSSTAHVSGETVLGILEEIICSQEQMKLCQKLLIVTLSAQDLAFEEIYARVRDSQPTDPLEQHGLSMTEFDQLLKKYHDEPGVREAVAKVRGVSGSGSLTSDENAQRIDVETIIKVHLFMVEQLESLMRQLRDRKCSEESDYDTKIVCIVLQAIVGAKIQEQFGLSSEDIETAVMMHRAELNTHTEFASVNARIGLIMSGVLDGWGSASFMAKV